MRVTFVLWLAFAATARCDHYVTLSVPRTASQADIKAAYRKLALKHHPDKPDGCPERFRRINEAHEVLGDAQRRREYDLRSHLPSQRWSSGGGGGDGPAFGRPPFGAAGGFAFEPAFRRSRESLQPVEPAVRTFWCSLDELEAGCRVTVTLRDDLWSRLRDALQGGWDGRGAQVFRQSVQQAAVVMISLTINGYANLLGWVSWWLRLPLLAAAFVAYLKEQLPPSPDGTYDIDVRPGWRAGTRVTFGRAPRRVTFRLREAPHRALRRRRDDLVFSARLSAKAAARGAKLRVPRLNGEDWLVELAPGEAHDGYTRRFSGGGMPIKGGPARGDLLVEVRLVS